MTVASECYEWTSGSKGKKEAQTAQKIRVEGPFVFRKAEEFKCPTQTVHKSCADTANRAQSPSKWPRMQTTHFFRIIIKSA